MTLPTITEVSNDDIIICDAERVFRTATAESPPIPGAADGQHVVLLAVTSPVAATDAQIAALEAAVESLPGVTHALALIGPSRLPVDRLPPDTTLRLHVTAGYRVRRVIGE